MQIKKGGYFVIRLSRVSSLFLLYLLVMRNQYRRLAYYHTEHELQAENENTDATEDSITLRYKIRTVSWIQTSVTQLVFLKLWDQTPASSAYITYIFQNFVS